MNKNKFLTLLMGECWHEWKWEPTSAWSDNVYLCTICGERSSSHFHPSYLSDPLPVIRFMEKEMPEVWEAYSCWADNPYSESKTEWLKEIHNLSNLITYLSKNREWGTKECPCPPEFKGDVEIKRVCPYCNGSGIIKHPALKYMEECDENKSGI